MSSTAHDCRFARPGTITRSGMLTFVKVEFYGYYTEATIELAAYNSAGQILINPFAGGVSGNFCQIFSGGSWNGTGWTSRFYSMPFGFKDQATANQAVTLHSWVWINSLYYDYI